MKRFQPTPYPSKRFYAVRTGTAISLHSPGGAHHGGGVRGKSPYSRQARARLLALMLSIKTEPAHFITLTYPDNVDFTWEQSFCHLTVFIKRLRRRFPRHSLLWKREYTSAGILHFHLIYWGPSLSGHFEEFSRYWYECCGSLSPDHLAAGTKIEVPRGNWHYYLSKYISKPVDGVDGRFWGLYGRSFLEFYDRELLELDWSLYYQLQYSLKGRRFGDEASTLFDDLRRITDELSNEPSTEP